MHILATFAAFAGALFIVLLRMQQASHAAREIADAAGEIRGLFRIWSWRRKTNVNPLDLVDDPREAATVMMVALAQADGAISEKELAVISGEICHHFGATRAQADALLARARWLTRTATDASDVMRRLQPLIQKHCTAAECRSLVGMLQAVANADGAPSPIVASDIQIFQRTVSPHSL